MRLTATFFNLEALVRTFQHDAVRYTRYPVSACLFLSLGQHGCSFLSGGSFTDLGYFNVQLIRLLDLVRVDRGIATPTSPSEPCMKLSPHTAPQ